MSNKIESIRDPGDVCSVEINVRDLDVQRNVSASLPGFINKHGPNPVSPRKPF
jgi:hypothetical protein